MQDRIGFRIRHKVIRYILVISRPFQLSYDIGYGKRYDTYPIISWNSSGSWLYQVHYMVSRTFTLRWNAIISVLPANGNVGPLRDAAWITQHNCRVYCISSIQTQQCTNTLHDFDVSIFHWTLWNKFQTFFQLCPPEIIDDQSKVW